MAPPNEPPSANLPKEQGNKDDNDEEVILVSDEVTNGQQVHEIETDSESSSDESSSSSSDFEEIEMTEVISNNGFLNETPTIVSIGSIIPITPTINPNPNADGVTNETIIPNNISALSLLANYETESENSDDDGDEVECIENISTVSQQNITAPIVTTETSTIAATPSDTHEEAIKKLNQFIENGDGVGSYRVISDSSEEDDDDDDDNVGNVVDICGASSDSEVEFVPKASKPFVKAKGEYTIEDLPPIEELKITVSEQECIELGKITSIVEQLVLVDSLPNTTPLDLDTVLFLDKGNKPLGKVFDVLGNVSSPLYCVRFNTNKEIAEKNISIGMQVYVAPATEHTTFIILDNLMKEKGCDASWEYDIEPPPKAMEYSDDEEELTARRVRRGKKSAKSRNNDGDDDDSDDDTNDNESISGSSNNKVARVVNNSNNGNENRSRGNRGGRNNNRGRNDGNFDGNRPNGNNNNQLSHQQRQQQYQNRPPQNWNAQNNNYSWHTNLPQQYSQHSQPMNHYNMQQQPPYQQQQQQQHHHHQQSMQPPHGFYPNMAGGQLHFQQQMGQPYYGQYPPPFTNQFHPTGAPPPSRHPSMNPPPPLPPHHYNNQQQPQPPPPPPGLH